MSNVDKLILAARKIVEEFDAYGEVLQTGKDDEYGPDSAIGELREALRNLSQY